MRILLDLDEVLCDFIGGACNRWGVGIGQLQPHWELGKWDMTPPLTKALGRCPIKAPITEIEFWARIDSDTCFWSDLKPMPWITDLMLTVQIVTGDVYIVSSPSKCVTSHTGKLMWVAKHLPKIYQEQRLIITPHKHLLANYDTILIDDRDSNVQAFRDAGGMGLVFPRYHNSQHSERYDPVSYISKYIGSTTHNNKNKEVIVV